MNGFLIIGVIIFGVGFFKLLRAIVDMLYEKVLQIQDLTLLAGIVFIILGLAVIITGLSLA